MSITGRASDGASTAFFLGTSYDLEEGTELTELVEFDPADLPPGSAVITWNDDNGRPTGLADIPANRAGWPVGAIWADNKGTGHPLLVEYDMSTGGASVATHIMSSLYVPKAAIQGEWGNSIDGMFYWRRGNRIESFPAWNDRGVADLQTARSYIYTSPWDDITNATKGIQLGITDPTNEDDTDHDFARVGTIEIEAIVDGIVTGTDLTFQVLDLDDEPLTETFTDGNREGGRTFRAFFHDPETNVCDGYASSLKYLTALGFKAKSWKDGFKVQITTTVQDGVPAYLFPAGVLLKRHLTLGGHVVSPDEPAGPLEMGTEQSTVTTVNVSAQVRNFTFSAPTGDWWFYPYCFSGIDHDENGDYFCLDTRNRVSDVAHGEGVIAYKTWIAPKIWFFDGKTGDVISTWFIVEGAEGSDQLKVKRDLATGGIAYNEKRRELIVGLATQDCTELTIVVIDCATCNLHDDDFGADSLDPWGVVSGSWEIKPTGGLTGAELRRLTSDGSGLITSDTTNPHGIPHRVQVHVQGQSGQKVRALINYEDTDNYIAGEIEYASPCSKLRLVARVAGSETTIIGPIIVNDIVADEWARLTVCYIPKEEPYPVQTMETTGFISVTAEATESEVPNVNHEDRHFDIGGRLFRAPVTTFTGNDDQAGLQTIGTGEASYDSFFFDTTLMFAPASEAPCIIYTAIWNDLTGWTEVVDPGHWSAASGVLSTNQNDALILDNTTATAAVVVRVKITMGGSTSDARVLVGYLDRYNHWFVALDNSGTNLRVRIGYLFGANETILSTEVFGGGSPIDSTDPVELQVFACGRQVRFAINELAARPYVDMASDPPGTAVALAVAYNGGGTDFEDYQTLKHRSYTERDCPGMEDVLDCDVCMPCHEITAKFPIASETDETGNTFTFNCRLSKISGTWVNSCTTAISGYDCLPKGQGELLVVSEFPHLLSPDLTHPFYTFIVEMGAGLNTGVVRLKVDYLDSNNYHYAEFDFSAGDVTIGKVVAGTDTPLNTELFAGSELSVQANTDGAGGVALTANGNADDCHVDRTWIPGDFENPGHWLGAYSVFTPHNGPQFAVDVSGNDEIIATIRVMHCCPDP